MYCGLGEVYFGYVITGFNTNDEENAMKPSPRKPQRTTNCVVMSSLIAMSDSHWHIKLRLGDANLKDELVIRLIRSVVERYVVGEAGMGQKGCAGRRRKARKLKGDQRGPGSLCAATARFRGESNVIYSYASWIVNS